MSTQATAPSAAETPTRLTFFERISQKHMTPLWLSLANLVTPEPVSACQPVAWSFADVRAAMIEAGGLITMTTIAAFIQLLPKGFRTARYLSTDATVFVAVEGRGRTRIGQDFVAEWQPRDIIVAPSWKHVTHEATDEAVLFSFSDRPIQEALQLFREERQDA